SPPRFGTFGGVFTPCTLTILGVIMFLRFGEVVGQAGIMHALFIVMAAKAITLLTAFSLSAIATNTRVRGGGAYFMISRTLGVAPGGAIGLVLYLAQSVSVAMYVIGFTEAFAATFPGMDLSFRLIASIVNLLVILCVCVGAGWTIRLQYGILAVLALSLISFGLGAAPQWSSIQFLENLRPGYTPNVDVRIMFALFFPAVTGIMAGANMSGDLKDPAVSIPRGTLWAIGVTGVVYIGLVLVLGGTAPRSDLLGDRMLMHGVAAVPVLVTAGIFAATLSSALGSLMGAPRILQALARDRVFPLLHLFAKGAGKNQEPRHAILLTGLIAQIAILAGDLNAVAPVITMFFMITYGTLNWACFAEMHSRNPSFRPRFRLAHESIPLAGAIGCLTVMLILNPLWALASLAMMALIYLRLQNADLETRWGDVHSGVAFERAKQSLLYLQDERFHPKNWRPAVLAFVGNPAHRLHLARMGLWLTDRGLLALAQVRESTPDDMRPLMKGEEELRVFIRDNAIPAFPAVVSGTSFGEGALNLIQCHGIGAVRPNTVLLGWSETPEHVEDYGTLLRNISKLQRSVLVVRSADSFLKDATPPEGQIDVWWRGRQHGQLMLLLAHLISQTPAWGHRTIRLLQCVPHPSGIPEATQTLTNLIHSARIPAEPAVVVSDRFQHALTRESAGAALVFLGFLPPAKGEEALFVERTRGMMEGLPTVVLVHSTGAVALDV
ncbi:MAG: amino acid permease, partial [Kiritimatiellia bacterium]